MSFAYITRTSAALPNAPIGNDEMEKVLGQIGSRPARERLLVLGKNGIRQRHYALDPETGNPTHTNASLTAEAARSLMQAAAVPASAVDLLACGTSSPDQFAPGHAVMVHGELPELQDCEVVSAAGICCAGVASLRYAAMAVASGEARLAVATGSEMASSYMQSRHFSAEYDARAARMAEEPELAFDGVFLRWMLSDGAGAFLLAPTPADQGLSLRIDWIDLRSYAHEQAVCMYAGGAKQADGSLRGWQSYASASEAAAAGALAFRQDVRQLNEHVVELTVERALPSVLARHPMTAAEVDWFLPHYSSDYFRDKVQGGLRRIDFEIPESRWFSNIESVGNVGSAAFYLLVNDLLHSERLRAGQRVLCFVPESGRFSSAWILLTAVAPTEA